MGPVAYLIHTFPQYSSTFINDEVDEMRRQGARLRLFAIRRPGDADFPPAFRRFRDETVYVFPLRPARFLARHLACLASRPAAYLGTLAWILTRRGLGWKHRKRTLCHFAEAVHLQPEIRRRGCRHVHVHFLFGNAAIALFLSRLHGMTYSLTAHGSDIFVERVLQAEKLAGARFVRVATRYNARKLEPLLPPARRGILQVIPFGIDRGEIPDHAPGQARGWRGPLRVLAVGRLIWQKAHFLLLQACGMLAEEGLDFRLRIVGEGPLRGELEGRIAESRLGDRVVLAGALPRSEVWREYRNADLFVLSSVSEGSPIVILEAMACGLPVVAPDLHGIPEMIEDGVDGLLFQTGSATAVAEAMRTLMADATLRQRMGIAAETSSRQLDHRTSVERFRRSLEACMAARPVEDEMAVESAA